MNLKLSNKFFSFYNSFTFNFDVYLATYEGKSRVFKLPKIEKADEFWDYIRTLLEDLSCCKNLLSPALNVCSECKQEKSMNNEIKINKTFINYHFHLRC